MSNILSIDTSSASCSVCLKTDQQESKLYQNNTSNIHGEVIFKYIKLAMEEVKINKEELDYIVFGSGPGSFTGLRVGCSVAQGLGYGLKIPIIPISSLRIIAQEIIEESNAQDILVINDAHMEELYIGEYKNDNGLAINRKPDYMISKAEINNLISSKPKNFFFAGNALNLINKELKKNIYSEILPKANFSFKLAEDLITLQKFIPAEKVTINYLSGENQWKRA